ncbi:Uncharacterised protein [Mycobacteroides abscessus subsp. abscessus]|nr:Uncharacterised protein [Mycobacteroides abscessus subsp. abscessus]
MFSNSASWAAPGRYASRPSASQAVGLVASKPAVRRAAIQSSRRSTATSRRSASGTACSSRST